MNRVTGVAAALVVSLSLLAAAASGAGGGSAGTTSKSPFGMTIVRFAKGTSLAQMQAIVGKAGGDVVADLSKIGAVAATPVGQDAAAFDAKVRADKTVTATLQDRVIPAIEGPDLARDGAATGAGQPSLGGGPVGPPDPTHNAPTVFGSTNPEGIVQWDDNRMQVPAAWARTTGSGVRVAVIDTGVQGSHKEISPNYDKQTSGNFIPCNTLVRDFGPQVVKALHLRDCSSQDTDGHGTWVASRIVGAANGFASNGVAPNAHVIGYKVLATGFGGLTSWIVSAMLDACSRKVDLINMSIGGYDRPVEDADDYLVWVDTVAYCRSQGVPIFVSAGNEHVRVNRVNMTVGGRALTGAGQVDSGPAGIASILPGDTVARNDLRGLLLTPGGVPGVIMVSATNNAIGAASDPAVNTWPASATGARDQLTYYSNYGSRVDIAAPGGARKLNIPRYDGGGGDFLRDGWGIFGALDPSAELCTSAAGAFVNFACFKVQGAGFGFLQGTSMSAPNVSGVAALTLAAHPELRGNPSGLLARLQSTARKSMVNLMVPNDPINFSAGLDGIPCASGFCHLAFGAAPISFADAYGAGMVNAAAAVAP